MTTGDAKTPWQATVRHFYLANCVLVVSVTRREGSWKAYCAAITGIDEAYDRQYVRDYGNTIPQDIADVIFPEFADLPYAI